MPLNVQKTKISSLESNVCYNVRSSVCVAEIARGGFTGLSVTSP